MAPQRDPISVRTTRLNNIILNKHVQSFGGAILKSAAATVAASVGRRSTIGGSSSSSPVSAGVAEALGRENLLDAFLLLYDECDKEGLKKRDRNVSEFITKYRPIIEETRQLRVNVDDFNVKALIGKGYFGNVHLVVERQTGDIYAMKKIKKSVVTTSQVKEERDIMSRRCSEWITNLQYAFQDAESLYLIMEFLPGGDLLGLMSRHGAFDEALARFYLAELTLAIHSLHTMGYVHRDIKPENILIDRFGHIKLADFGNAATLDRDGHVLSLSPVGTPDYIAPELLQTISTYKLTKSIHDVSCDFWSMGIIGYEMTCEITPFHEENVHETYSKILSHCDDSQHLREVITFPNDLKLSSSYKELIESLLTNPTNRLGYEQIRKHSYFEGVKWETLRSQVPPIIPTLNGDDDISHFDDVARKKIRNSTFVKKPLNPRTAGATQLIKSHDFSGKNLPFIGYSFVHMEKQSIGDECAMHDARVGKLNSQIKELQMKLKERTNEIGKLRQDLLRAEQTAQQSDTRTKILHDAKDEIVKMKNIIKEKTTELAACRTQIKTLQSSIKVEEEMWQKKEATITDLLRLNRQKYEEAKIASEQRYEKLIAEKKNELVAIIKKLDARESELNAKTENCQHLQEKMENYKEMLRQFKEQAQADKNEFEKNKLQLSETYEQKLYELRSKLRNEKDSKSRLTMELRDVRTELDDSISNSKSRQQAMQTNEKNQDELLKRLNREVSANNELHAQNAQLEQKLNGAQLEINRLERELKLAECSKNLAESSFGTQTTATPYETAPGSLTELHAVEDQLRADLQAAKESEIEQKRRADQLQHLVEKLEQMLEKFNESTSPMKPHPAPRNAGGGGGGGAVGDILERQNEKLEDKLAAVREQMILERQSARTANLAMWKLEKQLEETQAAHKMTLRRMELTEERIKRIQVERDEAQRLCKAAQAETQQRDERIGELRDEMAAVKRDVLKEHRMWEKAEQERMQSKSEIIEHIASVHKLEERVTELRQLLQQSQQKSDGLTRENKRLLHDLDEERERSTTATDGAGALQMKLQNLQDNYERLKYACTITDNQLTEVEGMLDAEQRRNKAQLEKLEVLYASVRQKDETISDLQRELSEAHAQRKNAEARIDTLNTEMVEHKQHLQDMQKKLIGQQQQLMTQTNSLFETQERVEVLTNESQNLQTLYENNERELNLLKEENARILSDLFHAKEEAHRLHAELKETLANVVALNAEIDELQSVLNEKENFYLQRDIKAEATLAQHKKLIDYLQLKVEDLSQRKKKTLADMLFGSSSAGGGGTGNSARKENISPNVIESSILYRTLQEELRREKQRCKTLQEQIEKLQLPSGGRKPIESSTEPDKAETSPRKRLNSNNNNNNKVKTNTLPIATATRKQEQQPHRFELALQELHNGASVCVACQLAIVAGSPFWRCKECKAQAHRKCRSNVSTSCGDEPPPQQPTTTTTAHSMPQSSAAVKEEHSDADTRSLGQYSYEAKLDTVDHATGSSCSSLEAGKSDCASTLVLNVQLSLALLANASDVQLDVNCAHEIEAHSILLLGCTSGLYACHWPTLNLVHIAGIDAVKCIAVSQPLAKAIMVGAHGESLYQCDYRQLMSRSQANACVKPALAVSVLDLPFANRASTEKWQLVRISSEAENALDSVAIAATSSRIVILKYDLNIQKFKPVRALDTATPVSAILYTRHTAIVSSDKFYEIDLDTYAAEEFVDLSDQTLSHTSTCQPVVAIRISKQEFLLCFMECGVFVDEFGCRSRPYDLNWEYTPTGFMWREPFLYITHFQSLQLMRLHRSYTKELTYQSTTDDEVQGRDASARAGGGDAIMTEPNSTRTYLPFYMPTLLAESDNVNAYILAIEKMTGVQEIYHVDALKAFKQKLDGSLSSIATSITIDSALTTDSI